MRRLKMDKNLFLFQSRGRDLLIGKSGQYRSQFLLSAVSVPWSGFINRKVCPTSIYLPTRFLFQSRGRDLLIGKSNLLQLFLLPMGVSVPWSGFINRKALSRIRDPQMRRCFSPVVGIY